MEPSADILGAVVEKVTDMRFGEFLRKEILDPLGMEDTGFYVPQKSGSAWQGHMKIKKGNCGR